MREGERGRTSCVVYRANRPSSGTGGACLYSSSSSRVVVEGVIMVIEFQTVCAWGATYEDCLVLIGHSTRAALLLHASTFPSVSPAS